MAMLSERRIAQVVGEQVVLRSGARFRSTTTT